MKASIKEHLLRANHLQTLEMFNMQLVAIICGDSVVCQQMLSGHLECVEKIHMLFK